MMNSIRQLLTECDIKWRRNDFVNLLFAGIIYCKIKIGLGTIPAEEGLGGIPMEQSMRNRCDWANHGELERVYHDQEWGRPVHEDRKLFELLILEGKQAGLSWSTILAKRETLREAFDHFDPAVILQYDDVKIEELLHNPEVTPKS